MSNEEKRSEQRLAVWCARHDSARGAYMVGRPGCDAGEYLEKVSDCRMVPAVLIVSEPGRYEQYGERFA